MRLARTALPLVLGLATGCSGGGGETSVAPGAVAILVSPSDQTVVAPARATFEISVNGTPPIRIQWRRDGNELPGEVGVQYVTPPTSSADNEAVFDVVVSNDASSVTSPPARLTVLEPPSIVAAPEPVVALVGTSATFRVVARGTAPFQYQWLRDGAVIPGSSGQEHTTLPVTAEDDGARFSVRVSGAGGSVESRSALLSVTPFAATAERMASARRDHSLTLLADGRVLVLGGSDSSGPLRSAETYDVRTQAFQMLPASMAFARRGHTAMRTWDARVLVVGGADTNRAEVYEPASSAFVVLPAHPSARRFRHCAVTLEDGRVLIVGGDDGNAPHATGLVFQPRDSTWAVTGPLVVRRVAATATALGDGRVLLVGGRDASGIALASAETYDPASNAFALATGKLHAARSDHSALRLADGRVLIVGGAIESGTLASAETFDPRSESFAPAGVLSAPRSRPIVVARRDGRPLVLGGQDDRGPSSAVDRYDPWLDVWVPGAGRLPGARDGLAAVRLWNGQTLVCGGESAAGVPTDDGWLFETAESGAGYWSYSLGAQIAEQTTDLTVDGRALDVGGVTYECGNPFTCEVMVLAQGSILRFLPPATGIAEYAPLIVPRYGHTTTSIGRGRFLVIGGRRPGFGSSVGSAEIFEPASGAWSEVACCTSYLRRSGHRAVRLGDGRVLLSGGVAGGIPNEYQGLATFTPGPDTFQFVSSLARRRDHTSTILGTGHVLVAGGQDDSGPLRDALLFDPRTGAVTSTGSMLVPRSYHTATLLPDGRVLVTGGYADLAQADLRSSVEIYDPGTGQFTLHLQSMREARAGHASILLFNGQVLLSGGVEFVDGARDEVFDPLTGTFEYVASLFGSGSIRGHRLLERPDGRIARVGGAHHTSLGYTHSPEMTYAPVPRTVTAQADFGAAITTGCAPLEVEFRDLSIGAISWVWDFGDPASGNLNTSTERDPSHVYADPGTYTVRLTAGFPGGSTATRVRSEFVEVQADVTFTEVHALLRAACQGCHAPGHQACTINPCSDSNCLDLANGPQPAYASLVDQDSCCGTMKRVEPGHSEASTLFLRLRGSSVPGCSAPTPMTYGLTPDDIDRVRRWIDCGAAMD